MPQIIEINDLSHPQLEVYSSLNENQLRTIYEPEAGLFIAESPNVILRALAGGYEPVSLLLEKKHVETRAKSIIDQCGHIPVFVAESHVLAGLTGFQLTRGMLAAMRRRKHPEVADICRYSSRIAVLEHVMNPTNVGAIIRSAAALHIDGILLTEDCSDPLYRRASRVSMGTVFQIPWTYLPSGSDTHYVDLLRSLGYKTAAMALSEDSVNVDYPPLMKEDKLAVILGSEGYGLSSSTIEKSDYTVCIPMSHGVDSLNVAAASAVAFWQLGNRPL